MPRPLRSTSAEKIVWLLAHRDLWEGLPRPSNRWRPADRGRLRRLVRAMLLDGLYSHKTYERDIETSILRHVALARSARARRAAGLEPLTLGPNGVTIKPS